MKLFSCRRPDPPSVHAAPHRRRQRQGSFLIVILLITFLSNGCVHTPDQGTVGADYRLSPEETLASLDNLEKRKVFMKAVVEAVINTETGRYPTKLAIIAEKPTSVRLEAIPVIGLPSFFLSVHKGILSVYLPQNGEYYTGPATTDNLARFFPFPMDVSEMISLLMGCRPALPAKAEPAALKGFKEEKSYRIEIRSRTGQLFQSLWIDPATGHPTRLERSEGTDSGKLTVNFDEYFKTDDLQPMPGRIRMKINGPEEPSLTLQYTGVVFELPTPATKQLFALPVPPGARKILLN